MNTRTSTADPGAANTGAGRPTREKILAVDPGPKESGWCLYELGGTVIASGVSPNEEIRTWLYDGLMGYGVADLMAIEMMRARGMPTANEEFLTCVEIGRFVEACEPTPVRYIYRGDVKIHLCGSARAKDPNVRQALLDLIGPQGTKRQPGPTYGVKSHAWSALAVAVTAESQL